MTAGRETWGAKADFILSILGYCVGLGNVWRFPYLCYANGGGAFLIPYILMIAVGAIPVLLVDSSIGQFTSLGCVSCWKIAPLFKGLGFAMVLLSAYWCAYYNMLLSYILYYMYSSFKNPLPWVGCNHSWNTDNCFDGSSKSNGSSNTNFTTNSTGTGYTEIGTTISSVTEMFSTMNLIGNDSIISDNDTISNASKSVRASEEFWRHNVLGMSDGLHELGNIRWQLVLCLIASWMIVYFCIIKGIKSSGKVVYFTATFPYLVLFVLFIRGVTLPGATDGIMYFIKPQWKKLLDVNVWKAAANQVFFSFAAGWGGFLTLSSYNKFNNNCYRDILMVSVSCGLSSIFAGVVIFSVIGFMANDSQLPIKDVVASGPGLAFIVYPEVVAKLPLPQIWALLFFAMLLTLGLDSQFVTIEVVITSVLDEIEAYRPGSIRHHKQKVILITCFVLLICGIPLTTQGGLYILTLLDWYSAGYSPMILALMEVLIISYVYGSKRFMRDIHSMIGYTPNVFWRVCWMAITPALLVMIYIFSFIDYIPASVGDYVFPPWAEAIGWGLGMTAILLIIVYGVGFLYLSKGTFLERLKHSLEPAVDWGPALNADRVRAGYARLPNRDEGYDDKDNISLNDTKGTYNQLSTKIEDEKSPVPV